ncbi:MAG: sugar ABC transporter permease [Firmicutes bacterium]|nr:sugar ABC transporter permease [Bacillota bacterium]
MRSTKRKIREAMAGYIFLMPNFVGFIIFLVFPVIGSFLLSFANWNLITSPSAAGIGNYRELVYDQLYRQALWNTAYFSLVSVFFSIAIALFIAVLLNEKLRGVTFFRTALFFPTVYSTVAVALIWQWIFDYRMGLMNHLCSLLKLGPYPWLISPAWAMPSVIIVAVWKNIGYNMVIFLAALQGVPKELYEAALIDGANNWQRFWRVTWPMISPATFFVTITSIISSFQGFDVTTVMTGGGPANATTTLVMLIYKYAFQFFRMGYASAIAYTLFAIVLLLTILQVIFSKRWVHY